MDECAERNRERIAEERAVVSARLESLQRQFRAIIDGSRWSTDDDEHDPEGSTIAFERATVLSLARDAEAELRELDAAAERVRTGAYGRHVASTHITRGTVFPLVSYAASNTHAQKPL